MTSEDWDMLPDVEDLEKIVNRELKKLEEFEKQKMRELVKEKKGWRLFKERNIFGVPRYHLEDTKTGVEIVMNGFWFRKKKVLKIFEDIE